MILVFGVIFWITRSTLGTAIGFEGRNLILRNHKGVESRHPINKVVYNESAIATPDMAVLLGKNAMRLYDPATVKEQILPRLGAAEAVPPVKMQRLLFRLQRPQGTVFILMIVGLSAVVALHLLR